MLLSSVTSPDLHLHSEEHDNAPPTSEENTVLLPLRGTTSLRLQRNAPRGSPAGAARGAGGGGGGRGGGEGGDAHSAHSFPHLCVDCAVARQPCFLPKR